MNLPVVSSKPTTSATVVSCGAAKEGTSASAQQADGQPGGSQQVLLIFCQLNS
jgi:hypothetical protein